MCRQCDNNNGKCTGSSCWHCECNYSCFKCQEIGKTSCRDPGPFSWQDVREKYVCLDCRHIWKSIWSKYMIGGEEWNKFCKNNYKMYKRGIEVGEPSCCK